MPSARPRSAGRRDGRQVRPGSRRSPEPGACREGLVSRPIHETQSWGGEGKTGRSTCACAHALTRRRARTPPHTRVDTRTHTRFLSHTYTQAHTHTHSRTPIQLLSHTCTRTRRRTCTRTPTWFSPLKSAVAPAPPPGDSGLMGGRRHTTGLVLGGLRPPAARPR